MFVSLLNSLFYAFMTLTTNYHRNGIKSYHCVVHSIFPLPFKAQKKSNENIILKFFISSLFVFIALAFIHFGLFSLLCFCFLFLFSVLVFVFVLCFSYSYSMPGRYYHFGYHLLTLILM